MVVIFIIIIIKFTSKEKVAKFNYFDCCRTYDMYENYEIDLFLLF